MSNKNTGGTAFPVQSIYIEDVETNSRGMSLRDYFAAKAMNAMLSSPNCPLQVRESELAAQAYLTADAMLKVRTA
jgi:hypothetical protein